MEPCNIKLRLLSCDITFSIPALTAHCYFLLYMSVVFNYLIYNYLIEKSANIHLSFCLTNTYVKEILYVVLPDDHFTLRL